MGEYWQALMVFLESIAPVATALTMIGTVVGLIEWRLRRFEARSTEKFTSLEGHLASGLARIDAANQRIDTLYQMFVDLLQNNKKKKKKGE